MSKRTMYISPEIRERLTSNQRMMVVRRYHKELTVSKGGTIYKNGIFLEEFGNSVTLASANSQDKRAAQLSNRDYLAYKERKNAAKQRVIGRRTYQKCMPIKH